MRKLTRFVLVIAVLLLATLKVGTAQESQANSWNFLPLILIPSTGFENGDFEKGNDGSWLLFSSSGWEDTIITTEEITDPITAHSGSTLAWLGGIPDEITQISQDVDISAGRTSLHYFYWINSTDACGFDFFHIYINNSSTPQVNQNLCSATTMSGWAEGTLDLSTFTGTSITVTFEATTDNCDISSPCVASDLFLDDISLR